MLQPRYQKFLTQLIRIPSVTGEKEEQKKILALAQKHLPESFQAQRFISGSYESMTCGRTQLKKFDALVVAHLDVVPAPAAMFRPRVQGDRLYGRGAFDMKGPLVALLQAVDHYYKNGGGRNIGFLLTTDEERGGAHGAGYAVNKKNITTRLVIVPDGGNDFHFVTEEKGVLNVILTRKGRAAHIARPWEGENAAEKLFAAVTRILKKYPASTETQWKTIATLKGFESPMIANNVIPDTATAFLNFRFIARDTIKDLVTFVQALDPAISITIGTHGDAFRQSADLRPLKIYKKIAHTYLGSAPQAVKYPAACDGRFFAAKNIPVLVTRPTGGGAHGDNEWVSLRGLGKMADIMTQYLHAL